MPELLEILKSESVHRINALQQVMQTKNLDAVWMTLHVNLFYFSGTAQNSHLLVPQTGDPVLFVKKYYPRAVIESTVDDVRPLKNISQVFDYITSCGWKNIGMELDLLPVSQFFKIQNRCSGCNISDVSMDIRSLRMIKSPFELDWIRRAARQLDSVFESIPRWIRIGITEIELASMIEAFLRINGHQGFLPVHAFNSFIHYGTVLFGSSGAVRGSFDGPVNGPGMYPAIPAGPSKKKLQPHEPIFIDLVAGCGGYLADATRVFSIGPLPEHLERAHQSCLQVQEMIESQLRSGIVGSELYQTAIEFSEKNNFSSHFMGPMDDKVNFIAHGFGLEIDELPLIAKRYDISIPANSVLAIEPKIIIPENGAVGIENSWIVLESGCERITCFPDEIFEVE